MLCGMVAVVQEHSDSLCIEILATDALEIRSCQDMHDDDDIHVLVCPR